MSGSLCTKSSFYRVKVLVFFHQDIKVQKFHTLRGLSRTNFTVLPPLGRHFRLGIKLTIHASLFELVTMAEKLAPEKRHDFFHGGTSSSLPSLSLLLSRFVLQSACSMPDYSAHNIYPSPRYLWVFVNSNTCFLCIQRRFRFLFQVRRFSSGIKPSKRSTSTSLYLLTSPRSSSTARFSPNTSKLASKAILRTSTYVTSHCTHLYIFFFLS